MNCTKNGELIFGAKYLNALIKLNDLNEGQYFNVIHKGIKFTSYVGVLQIDDLLIEVLPKIEGHTAEKNQWRDALIEMLKVTKHLKVNSLGNANVAKQNIHLLDIYFDWFLTEVEQLIHQGLIKQYYKQTKNVFALKGKLEFAGHIRQNIVHQERFYTTHQIYDKDHLVHQIIAVALVVIEKLSKGTYRYARCKSLGLDFPQVKSINADANTFKRIAHNRKNEPYKTVLAIARLIILNYSPNVKSGNEDMLALLFNMNDLWEQYILIKLQQQAEDWEVTGQSFKTFWESKTIRPDIVLRHKVQKNLSVIIDTKWKNYCYSSISSQDLRQIYVYNDFWDAKTGMLLYPAAQETQIAVIGKYALNDFIGKIGLVTVLDIDGKLNASVGKDIIGFFKHLI